jgi:hypothetical protein
MKSLILMALAACVLAGCDLRAQGPATDPLYVAAQTEALQDPPNRYVVAGTRLYPNGTEVYVLDGKSGQICYYFVAAGGPEKTPGAVTTDQQNCAGTALNPL